MLIKNKLAFIFPAIQPFLCRLIEKAKVLAKTFAFLISNTLVYFLYESLNFRIFISYLYILLAITNLWGFPFFQKTEHSHIIT